MPGKGSGSRKVLIESDVKAIVALFKRIGSKRVLNDMATRYGIHTAPGTAFGVPVSRIQQAAKQVKRRVRTVEEAAWNHELADALWKTGLYEARMAAALIDEPELVTSAQMDRWCRDFDNWGICDTVCFKLFDRVPPELAFRKVKQWSALKGEFQRRAGFVLLACLALHIKPKSAEEDAFLRCLTLIERGAGDERNFAMKGVSWALRAMGGRSAKLNAASIKSAKSLAASSNAAARWVGKDALKDITRPSVRKRLGPRGTAKSE